MIEINDNLLLRRANLSDANDLYKVLNNKESAMNMQGLFIGYSKEDIITWIESNNSESDKIVFVIESISTQEIIGYTAFRNIDYRVRKCSISVLIGRKDAQHKGGGKLVLDCMVNFGFDELNMNRIEGGILGDNAPSLKNAKKSGFKIEGIQKQAQYKSGKYHDLIMVAILR